MSIPRTGSSREAPKLGAGLKINTFFGDVEPLVVKPRIAWILLQCSNTKGYELLAAGELESYRGLHSPLHSKASCGGGR